MADNETEDWSDLVQRAIAGDETAFSAIYERTRENVYRTVALLVNRQMSDEITQDVYGELWRSLRHYNHDRPFLPWLHGIAVRQVRNYRRTEWRHLRKITMAKKNTLTESHEFIPDAASMIHREQEDLMSMVEALPLRLREIILLRYFHDYTLAEAAQILGIAAGTARSRHHRAILRLRSSFAERKETDKTCLWNEN